MTTNLSVWHLIITADPVVKCIMFILLLASIWSWTVIFQRISLLKNASKRLKIFREAFWSGIEMQRLHQKLHQSKQAQFGAAKVFQVGFAAFVKAKECHMEPAKVIESVERAGRVAMMKETDRLENGLPLLATIGAVSPYVGLFGTVWGIMGSFKALGGVEQATLSMVAPGISEALIATAMGLFVAIPAVVAYNRFSASVDTILNEGDQFQDELVAIFQRQLYGKTPTEQ